MNIRIVMNLNQFAKAMGRKVSNDDSEMINE